MAQDSIDNDRFPLVKPPSKQSDVETFRRGRGFSYGEISKAAASVQDVTRAGLPVDRLRRSVHDFNVNALKELLGKPTKRVTAKQGKAKAGKKQGKSRKSKSAGSKTRK
jgi:hypothetical protein